MSRQPKTFVSRRICEDSAIHDRIKLEQGALPALIETPSEVNKSALHPHGADEPLCAPIEWANKEDVAMKDDHTFATEPKLTNLFGMANKAPSRSVEVDTAKYQKYIDDPSLSDDQREEFIKAVWFILTAAVDLGFGIHPAQVVQERDSDTKQAFTLDEGGKIDSNDND